MFKRLIFMAIGIALLSYLLIGCGIRPQVDFHVRPVAVGEEQQVDEETVSLVMMDKTVSITVSPVDAVDLLEVTSDPHINPYIYISDWGVARPRYTIFDFSVKNNGESGLPALTEKLSDVVLMDDEGEQYEAIPYEEFKERYQAYPRLEREIVYSPPLHGHSHYRPYYYRRSRRPWYYHYDNYWGYRPQYVRRVYDVSYIKRAVLKGTMYRPVKLYPGGKRQGFLVFPLVKPDSSELRLIFPNVTNDAGENLEFRFQRMPVEKLE